MIWTCGSSKHIQEKINWINEYEDTKKKQINKQHLQNSILLQRKIQKKKSKKYV